MKNIDVKKDVRQAGQALKMNRPGRVGSLDNLGGKTTKYTGLEFRHSIRNRTTSKIAMPAFRPLSQLMPCSTSGPLLFRNLATLLKKACTIF